MLYFDVTKIAGYRHLSGLARTSQHLSRRLRTQLGSSFADVVWSKRRGTFVHAADRATVDWKPQDWFLSVELFSEEERPGIGAWLENPPCRTAGLYYDAIPLRFPEFTWPHSVARHPAYMKLLAGFERVAAISEASARELRDYWRWLGVTAAEPRSIRLGADGWGRPRLTSRPATVDGKSVVMVGILEPRKNQAAVLDAAEELWAAGVAFDLTLVGRVNPHFGRPIADRVRRLRRKKLPVTHVATMDDRSLEVVMQRARFLVMPSRAEGCGLPVLEALWAGVPVVCSDIPPIRENAVGGGCVMVPLEDPAALAGAMSELLLNDDLLEELRREACSRALPTWDNTVRDLMEFLN